jgi:dienelactone hydrolase
MGFCGGGIQAVRLSLRVPLGAVIAFYAPAELPAQYKHPTDPIVDLMLLGTRVKTPLQMHYGTDDYAVKAEGVEKLAALVRQAGTEVEVYSYEGALHGFYQTPRPSDAAAVSLARDRSLRFLHEHLC